MGCGKKMGQGIKLFCIISITYSQLQNTKAPWISLTTLQEGLQNSMNEYLLKTYTEQEVIEAIQKMQPTKAPTLDGMALTFYKKY